MLAFIHAQIGPGSHTKELSVLLDISVDLDAESNNLPQALNLLPSVAEAIEVAEILCYTPGSLLLRLNVLTIPLDQCLRLCNVLGHGLLGQNMFSCLKGCADITGLGSDGKSEDSVSLDQNMLAERELTL